MSHRYKRYSNEQLQAEEEVLQQKLTNAEQLGKRNLIAVNRTKIEIVRSYMLDQSAFQPGDVREMKEEPKNQFQIDEVAGVTAWGYRIDKDSGHINDEREAVLIALLGEKVQED